VVTAAVDLRELELEADGRYSFALYVSGLLVGTTTLTVARPTTRTSAIH
jgi:hypothetical protein